MDGFYKPSVLTETKRLARLASGERSRRVQAERSSAAACVTTTLDSLLKAVDDANSQVVVMLPASPSIHIQSGSSGVEVTRFESAAPGMPNPHIQSGAELHYAGIAAAARVPIFVKCNRGLSEAAIAAANATHGVKDSPEKMFIRTDGVTNSAPISLGVVPRW